ncbi:hypothetical protein LshimejAT787_0309360 [Lyophyllum shimeji]|uniref:Integrase catalytic domain-containing protein n=1 Tax=Lyophyllum shimeji TaxID=47721 RepID=A0A9P3PJL4_LYOSH|nr:hypothetical protein LshimejAT787_0309360 [Lyophyllum shimeji]
MENREKGGGRGTSPYSPQFVVEFTRELYRLLGIKLSTSTAYHPQSDGQTERVNQELEDVLDPGGLPDSGGLPDPGGLPTPPTRTSSSAPVGPRISANRCVTDGRPQLYSFYRYYIVYQATGSTVHTARAPGKGSLDLFSLDLPLPGAAVRDEGVRESVQLPHMLAVEVRRAHCRASGVRRDEVRTLAHGVHYNHDCVVSRVQLAHRELPPDFRPLAEVAGAGVGADIPRHLRPPVAPGDELQSFSATGVSGNTGVMVLFDDPATEFGDVGDIDAAPEHENPLVLRPLGTPHEPDSGAGRLQRGGGLGNDVLVRALVIAPPNVSEDLVFLASSDETLQSADGEELRFEQHDVRVVGASVSVVRAARECVGLPHTMSRTVVKHEVEIGQVQGPPCLTPIELLGGQEVFEILVVRVDFDLVPHTFKEMSPLLECADDGEIQSILKYVRVDKLSGAPGKGRSKENKSKEPLPGARTVLMCGARGATMNRESGIRRWRSGESGGKSTEAGGGSTEAGGESAGSGGMSGWDPEVRRVEYI